jgi:hypothetical protein
MAIINRSQPEVRLQDSLFYVMDAASVPGLDDKEVGSRGGNAGKLIEWGGNASIFYLEVLY